MLHERMILVAGWHAAEAVTFPIDRLTSLRRRGADLTREIGRP